MVLELNDPLEYAQKESEYLAVREKESRILGDEEVLKLPLIHSEHPHFKEWKTREKSFIRLIRFINNIPSKKRVLDIGCGNGWLTGKLNTLYNPNEIIGVDLNSAELHQASRLFSSDSVKFVFGNVMSEKFQKLGTYDLIIFNASLHYFPNTSEVLQKVKTLLTENGVLIVNDSAVYPTEEARQKASVRTAEYYQKLGFPVMSTYYFHLLYADLISSGLSEYRSFLSLFSGESKTSLFPLFSYKKG